MIYRHTDRIVPFSHSDSHADPNTSVHMTRPTGVSDTLAAASGVRDQTFTVANGAQFAVGNKLKIPSEYDILTIKGISTNDITVDRPLDIAHEIGEPVTVVTQNFIADGSVTPVTYSWTPSAPVKYHIHGMHIIITSTAEASLELFGAAPALTYGIHFYVHRPEDSERNYETYWIPIRSLNSFVLSGFSHEVDAKVLGGSWFSHLEHNFTGSDNTLILMDGAKGDSFNCTVQDNLTGSVNTAIEIKLSVHPEAHTH